MACFVVVSGLPGSGKSTLARALARDLEIPLLSKDVIKESLFDSLGVDDVGWSKRLGAASMGILFALATDAPAAVLESFWDHERAPKQLVGLGRPVIEIHCDCGSDVARERYRWRAGRGRHPGHLDDERERDFDTWLETRRGEPLALGGPLLRADTSNPVDASAIADWIRAQFAWTVEPVTLVPVTRLAATAYKLVAELETLLRTTLPDCRIEHIGATSMPDGVTKGDVDLNIRVSPQHFAGTVDLLRQRYDIAQPGNWSPTFASFSDSSRACPVGLQVTVVGSTDDFLVALRDLMRSDAELRHEYDRVKRDAAPLGADGYWAEKNAFLEPVVAQIARRS